MDPLESGDAYERYVGRWSSKVALEFVRWLAPPQGLAWVDVGSGTGGLASTILVECEPKSVNGIDSLEAFVSLAQQGVRDRRARFEKGDVARLPWDSAQFDVTVTGLVLNFVGDPQAMLREMTRVIRSGGRVAIYVWDYGAGMQMMRYFWDAAKEINPQDAGLDEGERFPLCQPEPLRELFESAGLKSVGLHAIEIPTVFQNFDDYWSPFLGGTGAAPGYLASVGKEASAQIRQRLQECLPMGEDGQIELTARGWAAQCRV
jgi:SAM-dependent methyltransferase